MSAIDNERMEENQRAEIFKELRNKNFLLESQLAEYKQLAEAAEANLRELGAILHYPECWDDIAYPTLADALKEIFTCSVCANPEAYGVDAKPFPAPKQDEK